MKWPFTLTKNRDVEDAHAAKALNRLRRANPAYVCPEILFAEAEEAILSDGRKVLVRHLKAARVGAFPGKHKEYWFVTTLDAITTLGAGVNAEEAKADAVAWVIKANTWPVDPNPPKGVKWGARLME